MCMYECILQGAYTMVLNKANAPRQKSQKKDAVTLWMWVLVFLKKQGKSGSTRDTVGVCDYSCLRHCHIQKGTQTLGVALSTLLVRHVTVVTNHY